MFRRRKLFVLSLFLALCFLAIASLQAKKKPPEHPINLNTATESQLQEVPGIGPATADRILKMRKSYGPLESVDDLRAIKGIGPKRLDKMRKYLTVGKTNTQSSGNVSRKPSPSSEKPPDKSAGKP